MQYHQITSGERYAIAALRRQGLSVRAIARDLGRAPSTISREVRAQPPRRRRLPRLHRLRAHAARRRRRSRRNEPLHGARSGRWSSATCASTGAPSRSPAACGLHGLLAISYETIYLHVWRDKRAGGELWRHLRQAGKQRRKRYGAYDSRGRLAGKRHISERPAEVETRAVGRPLGDRHGEGQRPGAATAWSPWSSAPPATS